MDPISLLLIALGVFTAVYLVVFLRGLARDKREGKSLASQPLLYLVSFVANFFDTLGVGSYATTTSMVRAFKLIPDEMIPGSLNVGYVLPTTIQAYVMIHGVNGLFHADPVQVDPRTLISLIAAAILGAWLGAGVVAALPRRKIQIGMGLCLAAAAVILLVRITFFHSLAEGAIGLTGVKWIIGMGGLFILGALMTLGIGLYAPCLILITILGMNDKSAFPIMMGSCAFLMPAAVLQFVRARAYYPRAMVAMALPGLIAVPIAFKWFQDLPMLYVKILVICVVSYTSVSMLLTARREKGSLQIAANATAAEAGVGA